MVRPDFALGRTNPWPETFAAFSDGIAAHVGKLRDLVVADFSTTGPAERAASEVVLMDAFQAYFKYAVSRCGIPSISLLGTPDDWRSVRRRASTLSEYGLEAWTRAVLPVLDGIVATAEGRVDVGFWRSFYRYRSWSGAEEITGWLLTLFPYLRQLAHGRAGGLVPNPHLSAWEAAFARAGGRSGMREGPQGPPPFALASSIASAPVAFIESDGSSHPLRFVAGMFGVTQDAAGALAPEFGWAIVHDDA